MRVDLPPRMRAAVTLVGIAGVVGIGTACSGTEPAPEDTIAVDDFADVYVDLRISALQTSNSEILPEERERILSEHGIEESDILEFVNVHGRKTTFMQEVWDTVEARMRRVSDSLNSVARTLPPAGN